MARPDQHPTHRSRPNVVLLGVVGLIVLLTVSAMLLLWPDPGSPQQLENQHTVDGTLVSAQVVSVTEVPCFDPAMMPETFAESEPDGADGPATGPDTVTDASASRVTESDAAAAECVRVRAALQIGKKVSFDLDELRSEAHALKPGDNVRLIEYAAAADSEGETVYAFYDHPRGGKMLVVVLLFVIVVVAVGRLRGALALVGVGAAIVLLTTFILPAILAGEPPVLVAIVGAVGIMIVVLYLAHGISHRTTAALFGSVFGILFTALAGFAVTRWLRFTGIGSTEDGSLLVAVPGLQMNDVLTATIVIAGLGILNDITVAQASAVWEMRELNPSLSKRRIYRSAMRVGRDHIASSIYTLVFAYAGAMLVVLLLLYTYPRDLLDLVTSEQIAQEIIRTLIGAAGLVLSMPVTTAFAVWFAKDPVPTAASVSEQSLGS